jgi:LysM repeat protein
MTILGIDVSHWSNLAHEPEDIKAQGYDFLFWKATEGSTYNDPTFPAILPAGYGDLLFAAYHYMDDSSIDLQIDNVRNSVPLETAIIIDMEKGSLDTASLLIAELQKAGYKTPLFYLPHWYWNQIGQPDLSHFPLLWASQYVKGSDYGSVLFNNVSAAMWGGYGGNYVGMLQFSSQCRLDGVQGNYDVSAFGGTRDGLAGLLNFSKPPPPVPSEPRVHTYTVRPGDALWAIALATLGTGSQWVDIAAANHLSNPNRLTPGQVLVIPGWNGVLRSTNEAVRYTVVAGDSLTSIAKRFGTTVTILYDANRVAIGSNPNAIRVGLVLSIPTIR